MAKKEIDKIIWNILKIKFKMENQRYKPVKLEEIK